MGHKPFLVLADHLTRKGIAVLRVDDRGMGKSGGDAARATTKDFADDAAAAVAFLKSRKEVNPKKIGLIGHSEGGIIAPLVANSGGDIAFMVLLAGTALPGEEILYQQGALIAKAQGAPDDAIKQQTEHQKQIFTVIRNAKDEKTLESEVRKVIEEQIAALPETERNRLGHLKQYAEIQTQAVCSPWFRFFLTYDPRPALSKLKCPVLALNGEKDLQVPPKTNLPEIEKALKTAGNKDVTIKELPGLNHLFQTAKTGAIEEYAQIEETMSPKALEEVADWILAKTR
jgi:alpha-beta hydrolase superfamily lysophospholipase